MEQKIAALKAECAGKLNKERQKGQKNHKMAIKSKTDLKC